MNRRAFLKQTAALATAAGISGGVKAQMHQPATGPLKVHPRNPRYFADGSGRAIFLTGAHTWANLQDSGLLPFRSSTGELTSP